MGRVLVSQETVEHRQLMDFVYREANKEAIKVFFKLQESTVAPTSKLEAILKNFIDKQDVDGACFLLMTLTKAIRLLKNAKPDVMSLHVEAIIHILSQINEQIFSNFSFYAYSGQLSPLLEEILNAGELSGEMKEIILRMRERCREEYDKLDGFFEWLIKKHDRDTLTETEIKGGLDQMEPVVTSKSSLQTFSLIVSQGAAGSSIDKTNEYSS